MLCVAAGLPERWVYDGSCGNHDGPLCSRLSCAHKVFGLLRGGGGRSDSFPISVCCGRMEQFGSYGLAAYRLGTISPSSILDLIELRPLVVFPGRCGLLVLLGLCGLLVLLKLCELVALLALASLSQLSAISAPSCLSASGVFLAPFSCTALLASACLISLAIPLRSSPSPSRTSIRT